MLVDSNWVFPTLFLLLTDFRFKDLSASARNTFSLLGYTWLYSAGPLNPKSVFMGVVRGQAAPRDSGEIPGNPSVDGGEAQVAAVVQGNDSPLYSAAVESAASPRSPLSVGLPLGEPLVWNGLG